jgi:hypothetical protein
VSAPEQSPELRDPTSWRADDLVDAVEVASRLGLSSKQVVLDWRYHSAEFPHPIARRPSLCWRWGDVEAWARAHPRHVANFQRDSG